MKTSSFETTTVGRRNGSRRLTFCAVLSGLCFAAVALLRAAAVSTDLTLADAPPAVQKAITANIGDGKVTAIEKNDESGVVSFYVEFTKDGQERDLELAEDGRLMKIAVALAETPPVVQKSILAQLGADKLDAIEKNFDSDATTYEVELTTKDGRESRFSIADDGALLEIEIPLEAAPAPVQKTITDQIGTGTLVSITRFIDGEAATFVADFSRNDKDRSCTVASDGKLLEIQISLEEATPEAQKTIREIVGNGTIISVSKSFEKREKVLPFKVESLKDGKPFNFSVGPKGRFLGADE